LTLEQTCTFAIAKSGSLNFTNSADNKSTLNVQGGGTVILSLLDADDEPFELTLRDVTFCPSSRWNLLSLSKLTDAGFTGAWGKGEISIIAPGNFKIGYAPLHEGLFFLALSSTPELPSDTMAVAANVSWDDPVWQLLE
jgi:hypothetical protein